MTSMSDSPAPLLAEDPAEVEKRVSAVLGETEVPGEQPAPGRFRVTVDIELGYDGGPNDTTDFELDPKKDLETAFQDVHAELLQHTFLSLITDWGLEVGSVQLNVYDEAGPSAGQLKGVTLYWDGAWHEHKR